MRLVLATHRLGKLELFGSAIFFLMGFWTLNNFEQHWLKLVEPMMYGMRHATYVSDCKPHTHTEGELVYMSCPIHTPLLHTLSNGAFLRELGQGLVAEVTPILEEEVQMYQWWPYIKETTRNKQITRTQEYRKEWLAFHSDNLNHPRQYRNPDMAYRGKKHMNDVRLGSETGIKISEEMLDQFSWKSESAVKTVVPIEKNGYANNKDGWVYLTRDGRPSSEDSLRLGEYRVRWYKHTAEALTVVGKQQGNTLVPFKFARTDNNEEDNIFWIQQGEMSLNEIANSYVNGNQGWKLFFRSVAGMCVLMGVACVILSDTNMPPNYVPGRNAFAEVVLKTHFRRALFHAIPYTPACVCVMLFLIWFDVSFLLNAIAVVGGYHACVWVCGGSAWYTHAQKNHNMVAAHDAEGGVGGNVVCVAKSVGDAYVSMDNGGAIQKF
eukprot:GDKI01037178.1.p1 GENE.GDKI01037178.1~~GDKI01037178.1.p1  ORF type:complete len:436 (-),score=97.35 GDKI01037178.1:24-1331(-)